MTSNSPFRSLVCLGIVLVVSLLLVSSSRPSYGQAAPNQVAATTALGTAFTYQGRLTDGLNPANGLFDFQFRLFNVDTAGTPIGVTVTREDVNVVDGVFSLALDFGSLVFTGESRYLEISVRPGASTGAFTLLSPRRNITPSPYAIYADQASRLSAPNGSTAVLSIVMATLALVQPIRYKNYMLPAVFSRWMDATTNKPISVGSSAITCRLVVSIPTSNGCKCTT